MGKYRFSLIVTTVRGIEELKPLFHVTSDDAELIITDSNYNEQTKEWLSKQHGYYQIVYAPIKRIRFKYAKDCILGMNLAFMYAENYWLLRGDDCLEFKSDFFEKAEEDIDYYSGMLEHKRFGIVGQKLWATQNQERWNNYSRISTRFSEIRDPRFTFSFGILPIEMVYDLNGYNELYDHGWGLEEEDFLLRGMSLGYKYYFDSDLMGYSYTHESTFDSMVVNRFIFELQRHEILSGKTRAFNAYDIRQSQTTMLAIKDNFIIER